MKTRKTICFLFLTVICISFTFGCVDVQKNQQEEIAQSDDIESTAEKEKKLSSLKIGDRDISEYTVIVGVNPFRFEENVGYDIPANYFVKEVYDRLGITLNIEEFSFDVEYGPIIVFGNNYENEIVKPYYKKYKEIMEKSPVDEDYTLIDDFCIASYDNAVYFLSGGIPLTELAVKSFFDDYVMSFCSAENGDVVLDADFSYTGVQHIYTVACVGDSITYGDGSSDGDYSYPVVLQNLLGHDNYRVINYGKQGATMCTNYTWAFVGSSHYKNLIKNSCKIDMTILWLGTNDAGIFGNGWDETVEKDFVSSFDNLLSLLTTSNSNMKIIILTPCFYPDESADLALENHIIPLTTQVAVEHVVTVFDMHAYTKAMFSESDFSDNLHPSDSGYVIVAEKVAELVHQYE